MHRCGAHLARPRVGRRLRTKAGRGPKGVIQYQPPRARHPLQECTWHPLQECTWRRGDTTQHGTTQCAYPPTLAAAPDPAYCHPRARVRVARARVARVRVARVRVTWPSTLLLEGTDRQPPFISRMLPCASPSAGFLHGGVTFGVNDIVSSGFRRRTRRISVVRVRVIMRSHAGLIIRH